MRVLVSVLGLLLVVAIVGVLAKKQLGSAAAPALAVPGAVTVPTGTPQQQVQQVQQAMEKAMQQQRPEPDEK